MWCQANRAEISRPCNQTKSASGSPPKIILRTKSAAAEMGAECRYEVAQAAYVKLALHALKHPATAVNGLLVGRLVEPSSSPAVVSVIDAVPLSHHPHHLPLLPTLELALTLVEDHFATQGEGLAVVGYYHANARCDDTELPPVAKRVGDHIFRYFPRSAVLLVSYVSFVLLISDLRGLGGGCRSHLSFIDWLGR